MYMYALAARSVVSLISNRDWLVCLSHRQTKLTFFLDSTVYSPWYVLLIEGKNYPSKKKPSLEKLKTMNGNQPERGLSRAASLGNGGKKGSNNNIFIDDEILSPVRESSIYWSLVLKSTLFRRQEQAFFSHVERTRNPSGGSKKIYEGESKANH